MSKHLQNVTQSARIIRGGPLRGGIQVGPTGVALVTRWLAVFMGKEEPKGRFFADHFMLEHAGGPWFAGEFQRRLTNSLGRLPRDMRLIVGEIHSGESAYVSCSLGIKPAIQGPYPVALQIVHKAHLIAISDEILSDMITQYQ